MAGKGHTTPLGGKNDHELQHDERPPFNQRWLSNTFQFYAQVKLLSIVSRGADETCPALDISQGFSSFGQYPRKIFS
jgi:hypothetical protein